MGKKYLFKDDVKKELNKQYEFIDFYKLEVDFLRKRAFYLSILYDYLDNDGLCSYCSKVILKNNIKLQEYVLPIICKLDISTREKINRVNYKVNPTMIGRILNDFIDFVCEFKGHKIGVGEVLIQRFIANKVEY